MRPMITSAPPAIASRRRRSGRAMGRSRSRVRTATTPTSRPNPAANIQRGAGFHRLGPGHDRRARTGCDFTDGEARPGHNFMQVFEIARLDTHSIGTCAERPDVDEHASRIGGIDP